MLCQKLHLAVNLADIKPMCMHAVLFIINMVSYKRWHHIDVGVQLDVTGCMVWFDTYDDGVCYAGDSGCCLATTDSSIRPMRQQLLLLVLGMLLIPLLLLDVCEFHESRT